MLQMLWDVGRLVQYANDVDAFRMGKVKHRIGKTIQSPESERGVHIGYGVAHGASGWMPFDVIERLSYRVSKLFCNLQVCNIKVVIKRTLQVADRLGK